MPRIAAKQRGSERVQPQILATLPAARWGGATQRLRHQKRTRYGVNAKTVPKPYFPPLSVVPYSFPFTSTKPATGSSPSLLMLPKLYSSCSGPEHCDPEVLTLKTVPSPYAPPSEVVPSSAPFRSIKPE